MFKIKHCLLITTSILFLVGCIPEEKFPDKKMVDDCPYCSYQPNKLDTFEWKKPEK